MVANQDDPISPEEAKSYRVMAEMHDEARAIAEKVLGVIQMSLSPQKDPEYNASIVVTVLASVNESIRTALEEMGALDFHYVDPVIVQKAREVVDLEDQFRNSDQETP